MASKTLNSSGVSRPHTPTLTGTSASPITSAGSAKLRLSLPPWRYQTSNRLSTPAATSKTSRNDGMRLPRRNSTGHRLRAIRCNLRRCSRRQIREYRPKAAFRRPFASLGGDQFDDPDGIRGFPTPPPRSMAWIGVSAMNWYREAKFDGSAQLRSPIPPLHGTCTRKR
jgi:hypothetical protein